MTAVTVAGAPATTELPRRPRGRRGPGLIGAIRSNRKATVGAFLVAQKLL